MSNLHSINTGDRRVAERRSALDVHLCLVDLGDNRSGMLLDVSETGIGVQTVEGPGAGFTTTFRFQLPETAVLVEGEGEIAWADRAGRMGIRYTRIAPELMPELKKWITSESNPLFANQPATEEMADLDARDRVAQLEARIIVSGWAQLQAINFLVDQVAAMTQASGVAIAVEDGSGIVCKASSGIAPQVGVRVNPRSGLSWECVRTQEIVQCADTENDPRVDRLVCRQLNMRSAMLVPVKKDGRIAGLVEVFSSRPHAFTNQTVILLKRVAEAVASLDETAPDVSEDSVLQMPSPAPQPAAQTRVGMPMLQKLETEVPKPASPEPRMAATAPAAVAAKPAPQPAPAPALVKPVEIPAAPAPAFKPVTTAPTPQVIASTPVVVPVAAKPAPPTAPPPVVQKPAVADPIAAAAPSPALTPREKPAVAQTPVVVDRPQAPAPPPVVSKPITPERPTVAPAAEKKVEIAPPPPPPKEVPVVLTKAVETEKPIAKPVSPRATEAANTPPVLSNPAPLPSVAFTGAAASAAPSLARAVQSPIKREEPRPLPLAEEHDTVVFPPESVPSSNRPRLIAGAAAAVLIAVLGYGVWRWTRPAATPTTAPVSQQAPAPAAPTQAGSVTPVASTAIAANTLPVSNTTAPAASKPQPPKTSQPQTSAPSPQQASPASAGEVPAAASSQPVVIASQPLAEPTPAAPPLAIAPPNTVGMASLFSGPAPTPKLSRQTVSQGVTGGKQLVRVQPVYPTAARTMRVSGTVTMVAHVNTRGVVTKVDVVSGHAMLNAAAVDAVRRWKYEPFQLNGQPIENDVNVQVRFDNPR